jgi:hypothetical protein
MAGGDRSGAPNLHPRIPVLQEAHSLSQTPSYLPIQGTALHHPIWTVLQTSFVGV